MRTPLLEISNLHLAMQSYDGPVYALAGINLTVERGEVWGLVGETGCGKSLTGLSVSRLVPSPPAQYLQGSIQLDGTDVLTLSEADMRAYRGKRIGMIFQDPTTNLNPSFRIGEQLIDVALAAARRDPAVLDCAPKASGRTRRQAARQLAQAMLERVGIQAAAERLDDYPHQFSGGMRQRVLIAMALIGRPNLLIADEPTTALDVSVQAQILKLIKKMVQEDDMGVVLITHNLGVVAQTCSHVAVMYAGTIVESGTVKNVIENPTHPYTQALLSAIPTRDIKRGDLQSLAGSVPNLINPPSGCRFAPRCRFAVESCTVEPPTVETVQAQHKVACPIVLQQRDQHDA